MKKLLALSSLAAIALTACGGGSSSDPIKLGFIGPLTGDAAPYGIDTLNGVRIKIDEVNKAGGINGRQVQLVAEDGKCSGADAASAAQKLVNVDKVVAIVGGACSGETLAASPIAEAAKIVLMSPLSSSPDVTDAGAYIFRDYPSDALKTKAMAKYFAKKAYAKVAIISENTDFASGFRTALLADVGEDKFVFDEMVEPSTKDFRSLMTRLKDVDFDVFVVNAQSPAVGVAMMQQMREQGVEKPMITHDAVQTVETITTGGDAVEGLYAINVPSIADASPFGQKLIAAYGKPDGAVAYAASAYDAAGVLFEAIGTAGTDGTAMRDYLNNLQSYAGTVGTFSFDDNGDVLGIAYKLLQVKDGVWVELEDAPAN